jgi:hypothetical protein
VDRRHHLVAQLAHAERDDRGFEVHVGRRAEHLAQAAVHPTSEDGGDPGATLEATGDILEHRLMHFGVSGANGAFNKCPLRFVQAPANARTEIHRVGGCGSEPRLVAAIRSTQVEHVERVARTKGKLDVDAAKLAGEGAVLVLRVDDVDLGPER